jgi:UDP-3-O-[3-hydroxymyristoyl] glucosamine N-acyltransferase
MPPLPTTLLLVGRSRLTAAASLIAHLECRTPTIIDAASFLAELLASRPRTVAWHLTEEDPDLRHRLVAADLTRSGTRLVHPQAYVEPGCVISPGALIGANAMLAFPCELESHVVLGDACMCAPGVRIGDGTIIGSSTRIEAHARIGRDARIGSGVVIAAGVCIGDGAVVPEGTRVTVDMPDRAVA